jgi:hypothetical protein
MNAVANRQEYLGRLKHAVENLHHCRATHRRTIPVHEVLDGQTVWDGKVEMFWLTDHPDATRCYAWSYKEGEYERFAAVLEIPPVIGAATAVRALFTGVNRGMPRDAAR